MTERCWRQNVQTSLLGFIPDPLVNAHFPNGADAPINNINIDINVDVICIVL